MADSKTRARKPRKAKVASLLPNAEKYIEAGQNVLLIGLHGTGKALPNHAPVMTPNGWVAIADLAVGQKIIGRDGNTYEVSGVFPQGEKSIVEMHFSDGAVVECCEDHLWSFHKREHRNTGELVTEPASFFEDNVFSTPSASTKEAVTGQAKWYLPHVEAVDLAEQDLFIEPYAMGLLIGDGSFRPEYEVRFSTGDPELVPVVESALGVSAQAAGGVDYRFSGISQTIIPAIKDMGLHKSYSYEKHIPSEYLVGSIEQRLSLLQGLLDSDGSPSGSGAEFVTTSEQLAKDVKNLVHSLGGVSTLRSKVPTYTYNGEGKVGRTAYRMYIRLDMPLFRLGRKQSKVKPYKAAHRRLVGVVRTDRSTEMTCISVTSPDRLFLTSDFTPTHNTETVRELAGSLGLKVKSFSCSTLDPYTDLVGVPVPTEVDGRMVLKMVRPVDIDDADVIFFDELNRARPEVLDAVLEITQNGTINGEPLPNLKCCWGAMNPPNGDYKVDELDPALMDRFDAYIEFTPRPSVAYMAQHMPKAVAQALKSWWDDHNREKREHYISPRRLHKIGAVFMVHKTKKSILQALPPGGKYDSTKLYIMLDEAINPEKRVAREESGMGDAAADTFRFDDVKELEKQADELATFLKKNPQAFETHRKVALCLEKGVSGAKLVSDWADVLDSLHKPVLEKLVDQYPQPKQSQIRSAYIEKMQDSGGAKWARAHSNFYDVISTTAKNAYSQMPAIP